MSKRRATASMRVWKAERRIERSTKSKIARIGIALDSIGGIYWGSNRR